MLAIPGKTELHFIIKYIVLSSNFTRRMARSCFRIICNSKAVCVPTPGFFVLALDGFRALQFVSLAPVVLAEIKSKNFSMLFALSFYDKSFHIMPLKINFSMTWCSWHHIILFFLNYETETN